MNLSNGLQAARDLPQDARCLEAGRNDRRRLSSSYCPAPPPADCTSSDLAAVVRRGKLPQVVE